MKRAHKMKKAKRKRAPITSMRFVKADFDEDYRKHIESNGSKCIAAWECVYGNHFLLVLKTEEVCGFDGCEELRLTVTAVTKKACRPTTKKEVLAALKAADMSLDLEVRYWDGVAIAVQPLPRIVAIDLNLLRKHFNEKSTDRD